MTKWECNEFRQKKRNNDIFVDISEHFRSKESLSFVLCSRTERPPCFGLGPSLSSVASTPPPPLAALPRGRSVVVVLSILVRGRVME